MVTWPPRPDWRMAIFSPRRPDSSRSSAATSGLAPAADAGSDAPVAHVNSMAAAPYAGESREVVTLYGAADAETLALAWVGRGDFGAEDFDTALTQAFDAAAGSISEILLDLPRLGDWLEEGAVACGADLNQVSGQALRGRNDLLH